MAEATEDDLVGFVYAWWPCSPKEAADFVKALMTGYRISHRRKLPVDGQEDG